MKYKLNFTIQARENNLQNKNLKFSRKNANYEILYYQINNEIKKKI